MGISCYCEASLYPLVDFAVWLIGQMDPMVGLMRVLFIFNWCDWMCLEEFPEVGN